MLLITRLGDTVGCARVRPQSLWVGRAVRCAPGQDHPRAAACRGLPALPPPTITEALPERLALHTPEMDSLKTAVAAHFLPRKGIKPMCRTNHTGTANIAMAANRFQVHSSACA